MSAPIGRLLQQARQARNLTVEQVARATHLRPHHIQAIEEGRFEAFPSPVQARAFLRIYADYLGVALEEQTPPTDAHPPSQSTPATVTGAPSAEAAVSAQPERTQKRPPTSHKLPSPPPQATTTASIPAALPSEEKQAPETVQTIPVEDANAIFRSIGETLRQQREFVSLTLEEIARQIHLRPRALQALERGEVHALPSPVQARGMLSSYAQFLGLDAEALLLRFAEGLQRQHQERLAAAKAGQRDRTRPPVRRWPPFLTPDLIGGAFLIFALIATVVWSAGRVSRLNQVAARTATLPSVSEILLHTPSVAGDQATVPPEGQISATENMATSPVIAPAEGKVQVVIIALQRAWVRVSVDGQVVLEGRVSPGQVYPFGGEERIEVLTGNGAALQIFYNQRDLGTAGSPGEVVDWIFTAEGRITPTPTVTLTPTASPSPTTTPRPSPTPRISPTPSP